MYLSFPDFTEYSALCHSNPRLLHAYSINFSEVLANSNKLALPKGFPTPRPRVVPQHTNDLVSGIRQAFNSESVFEVQNLDDVLPDER